MVTGQTRISWHLVSERNSLGPAGACCDLGAGDPLLGRLSVFPRAGPEGAHRDSGIGIPKPPQKKLCSSRDLPWLPIAQRVRLQFISPLLYNSRLILHKIPANATFTCPCTFPTHRHNCHHLSGTNPAPGTMLALGDQSFQFVQDCLHYCSSKNPFNPAQE